MPTAAPTTTTTVSEQYLEELRAESRELHDQAGELEERAEQMVKRFREDGVDPSKGAAREAVMAEYQRAEEYAERAQELRDRYTKALESRDGAPHARHARMPAVEFDATDVMGLRDQALAGGNGAISARTVSSVEAPQATATTYGSTEPALRETLRVAALIPTVSVSSSNVTWWKLGNQADADVVAEGGTKPESTPTWVEHVTEVKKIAHVSRATTEMVADFTEFDRVVTEELLGAVIDKESQQLLSGTGVGDEVEGLLTVDGTTALQRQAGETLLDAVYRGITAVRVESKGLAEPRAILFHPEDLAQVVTAKDDQGSFHSGSPFAGPPGTVWGVPAYPSTHVPQGTALVADLDRAARIFLRQPLELVVNQTPGWDDWQHNRILFRAEERLGLAVPMPEAISKVNLDEAA